MQYVHWHGDNGLCVEVYAMRRTGTDLHSVCFDKDIDGRTSVEGTAADLLALADTILSVVRPNLTAALTEYDRVCAVAYGEDGYRTPTPNDDEAISTAALAVVDALTEVVT